MERLAFRTEAEQVADLRAVIALLAGLYADEPTTASTPRDESAAPPR